MPVQFSREIVIICQEMKLVLINIPCGNGNGVLQCLLFMATVHTNAILLDHLSNVSDNRISAVTLILFEKK